MQSHTRLLVYHNTGTGKTLICLLSCYQHPEDIVVIGVKTSERIFRQTIEQLGLDPGRIQFYTLTKMKTLIAKNPLMLEGKSVIVDEAHHLRNNTLHNMMVGSSLTSAKILMLATATPMVNHPVDLCSLINLLRGDDVLPTDRSLFNQMFLSESGELINTHLLTEKLAGYISYYAPKRDDPRYPKTIEHTRRVVMSPAQMREYREYLQKVIYSDGVINSERILDIDFAKLPAKQKNNFLSTTRQLSNTQKAGEISPKMLEMVDQIAKGSFPVVVFSNFLDFGLYTLALVLEKRKMSYTLLTGHTSREKVDAIADKYNRGAIPILLLSSAGSESLHLRATRQLHIMEIYWNPSLSEQIKGRVSRFLSHEGLPPAERKIDVYYWISIFPPEIRNQTADEYLLQLGTEKREITEKYQDLAKKISIENAGNTEIL